MTKQTEDPPPSEPRVGRNAIATYALAVGVATVLALLSSDFLFAQLSVPLGILVLILGTKGVLRARLLRGHRGLTKASAGILLSLTAGTWYVVLAITNKSGSR